MIQKNLQNREKLKDLETKLYLPNRKWGGGGINQEVGINICTLMYIKQVGNKDLLYSTEKSTLYSMMLLQMALFHFQWVRVHCIYVPHLLYPIHTCTPMFTEELFTIAKIYKLSKCPSTKEQQQQQTTSCTYFNLNAKH